MSRWIPTRIQTHVQNKTAPDVLSMVAPFNFFPFLSCPIPFSSCLSHSFLPRLFFPSTALSTFTSTLISLFLLLLQFLPLYPIPPLPSTLSSIPSHPILSCFIQSGYLSYLFLFLFFFVFLSSSYIPYSLFPNSMFPICLLLAPFCP